METTFKAKNYLTTFHAEKENGLWKAWSEFNGERKEVRYCLNRKHAERTRTMLVQRFWGNKLN